MCKYSYCYYSACRHGEFIKVSYCDKDIILGLPRGDDRRPPDHAGADNNAGAQLGPSSSHPPTSNSNNSSSSYTHTQQHHQSQHSSNMSTLMPSEAGGSPISIAVVQGQNKLPPRQAAFIPRSACGDDPSAETSGTFDSNISLLDRRGYSNVNIDIPFNTQSSLHMEVSHDGKVTELVARFESYAGCSDAAKVSHDGHPAAPSHSDDATAASHAEPVRESRLEHPDHHFSTPTGSQTRSGHSPRKPIPSQWLPKSTGPSLATAQRAKERTYKRSTESNSPGEAKTIRGARSSVDLSRAYSKEGTTYLTKEALAAVESTITSPPSPLGHGAVSTSPSKKAWNSPTRSPLRIGMTQQPKLSFKMSPTKSTHLDIKTPSGHSRAPSSVATSTDNTSFYTAQGSPVRSPTDSEQSFHTAVEYYDDPDVPSFGLLADSDDHQVFNDPIGSAPIIEESEDDDKVPTKLKAAHELSPKAGSNSLSASSIQQASRIPRIGTISRIAAPVQISTLKRAESVTSLKHKVMVLQSIHTEAGEASSPEIPLTASPGRLRTFNSFKTTSGIQRSSDEEQAGHNDEKNDTRPAIKPGATQPHVETERIITPPVEAVAVPLGYPAVVTEMSSLGNISDGTVLSEDQASAYSSRTASAFTVGGTPKVTDPVLLDSAIIYSRKKTDTPGTALASPYRMPPIIVMMAHNLDIGNLSFGANHDDTVSVTSDHVCDLNTEISPVRGRRGWYVPGSRRQRDSDRSTHSSMGSDLRATAAEFVPRPASSVISEEPFTTPAFVPRTIATIEPSTATIDTTLYQDPPGTPDMTVLDSHGIPFLWYMYGVQFAYEQGYRNGRPKSPKKLKPKKQRSIAPCPVDATNPPPNRVSAIGPSSVTSVPAGGLKRLTSAVSMPPPAMPAHRGQEENRPTSQNVKIKVGNTDASPSFSSQFNVVDQVALANRTNTNASPGFRTPLPSGPRSMQVPTYYTIPRRGNRRHPGNGLYGGRGNAAGIPMDATAPFPNPVAPQGRLSQAQVEGSVYTDYSEYTIGREACGMIQIDNAGEQIGGMACNACDPDH